MLDFRPQKKTSKVLFLVTELQRPVGGLHRYTTELLPAWRSAVQQGKAEFEPLVVSIRDPSVPLSDLRFSSEYRDFMQQHPDILVYEGIRGGERCLFLESTLTEEEKNSFHGELWMKFRVKSEKVSQWGFYKMLNSYWNAVPKFADFLVRKRREPIEMIDAQDWLAFPAGFLAREAIGKPLNCRFHSGEFGRSLGSPDLDSPPVLIEAAALQEADYVQGVSVHEAQFEIYRLLPLKQNLREQLHPLKSRKWLEYQHWKENSYEDFLLYEAGEDLEIITETVAGITNGIILDDWRKVRAKDIDAGRQVLEKVLPKKDKYLLFIGRAEWRKGIDALLEAFSLLKHSSRMNAGLVVSSNLSTEEYQKHYSRLAKLKIESDAVIYNGWLGEDVKKGIFCAADVIALPSLYEPFGLVTLEALAADMACDLNGYAGPIVIVGDTGGMSEVIRNGANGFKVPMEEDRFDLNPAFLARILRIALGGEEIRKKITKGGASRVQQRYFDWEFIVQKVFEIYRHAQRNYMRFGETDAQR